MATPIRLVSRRTRSTLPDMPTVGSTYVVLSDLFDDRGDAAGRGFATCSIVDVTAAGPVVAATMVLRLADGEIHYQRVFDRFGAYPRSGTGAILGGTGAYRDVLGEVEATWPDADQVDVVIHQVAGARG
ncbi:allene oxide cyclase barrel-like domain-containing protein [Actinokineospora iranica]|uniref:Allene oxide cyclase barrel-like domain-containing protein n=1 Tax=Actinokineospora iranica TaxID=1271860 RepID=A0A1G6Z269_9PSEU|nr:hypothetical protein [Actinokineospora iranica]SDD96834.1 hypothetical protein SAMN05216174_12522 [Actinokineospora iranica]